MKHGNFKISFNIHLSNLDSNSTIPYTIDLYIDTSKISHISSSPEAGIVFRGRHTKLEMQCLILTKYNSFPGSKVYMCGVLHFTTHLNKALPQLTRGYDSTGQRRRCRSSLEWEPCVDRCNEVHIKQGLFYLKSFLYAKMVSHYTQGTKLSFQNDNNF